MARIYLNSVNRDERFSLYSGWNADSWIIESEVPSIFEELESKVFVDLGCGFGSDFIGHVKKKEQQPTYIHIDSDPSVFDEITRGIFFSKPRAHCRKIITPYGRTDDLKIVADAKVLPLEDQSVNLVHSELTFADTNMPEEDQVEAMKEIERILKLGGHYISIQGHDKIVGDYRCSIPKERLICPSLEAVYCYDGRGPYVFRKVA